MPWNGCPRPPARRFTGFPLGAVRATGPWVPDHVRRTTLAPPTAQGDVGVRITGAARSSARFWTAAVLGPGEARLATGRHRWRIRSRCGPCVFCAFSRPARKRERTRALHDAGATSLGQRPRMSPSASRPAKARQADQGHRFVGSGVPGRERTTAFQTGGRGSRIVAAVRTREDVGKEVLHRADEHGGEHHRRDHVRQPVSADRHP